MPRVSGDDVAPGREGAADGDVLPDELDVTAYVGPYLFPSTRRRRIAGTIYVGVGAAAPGGGLSGNGGLLAATVSSRSSPRYHFAAAWPLKIDQTDALPRRDRARSDSPSATRRHSSRGVDCGRPAWRILLYSADEPPSMRGLVELDAVDGHVLGEYTEPNPEDWSKFGLSEAASTS